MTYVKGRVMDDRMNGAGFIVLLLWFNIIFIV